MRADAHYVDQLSTRREMVHTDVPRSTKRGDAAEPAAGEARERRDGPELDAVRDARPGRDVRSDWLLPQLLAEIATIHSSADLLAGEAATLARRANVDVIRAHAWRATFLLRAQAIVDGTHRVQIRPRPVGDLLMQLREGLAPECRLSGLDLQMAVADWTAAVAVDEPALLAALSGAVISSIALLPDASGAVVKVAATTLGSDLRTVDVIQDEAAVPAVVSSLFFDPTWSERPGGAVAALGAACIKGVAALHGGEAVFMTGARRGSTIRINLAAGR